MIGKEDWLNAIEEFLEELSDEEFQRRVWVRGEGPEVSSHTEFMCGLFDDYSFDSFLDESWSEFGFSQNLHDQLQKIRTQLNQYLEQHPLLEDAAIVDDPSWREISQMGAIALKRLKAERG